MIAMKHLSFGYKKNKNLFTNLSLEIAQGGICGLLGKNGSGKTTLLKIMAGLIFPREGSCEIVAHIPKRRHPYFLSNIYFLPEDLFVPALTVDKYVKYYSPFYPKFSHSLFQTCLHEFALPRNQLLTQLSHGQKKKFLISFGLATDCRLCIFDEPTNGLDIPSKAQFRKLLASTISDEKLFIISTHQVHDVENLIDSIVVLEEGNIIFRQRLTEIIQQLSFVYQQAEPDSGICFYSEKTLAGYAAVLANRNNQDTQVNLEILFNAILSNPAKIQAAFLGVES